MDQRSPSIFNIIDEAKAEIWREHPDWSEQQRQQSWDLHKMEIAHYMFRDSKASRPIFARPAPPAIDEARPRKRQARSIAGSVSMRRSCSSRGYTSALSTAYRRQSDSRPYPGSTAMMSSMTTIADTSAASRPPPESDVFPSDASAAIFDPAEYIALSGVDMSPIGAEASSGHGQMPLFSSSVPVGMPLASHSFSPSLNESSIFTQNPLTSSEAMSRHTSRTSASAVDEICMSRIGSAYTIGSTELPFTIDQDGLTASFMSCANRAAANLADDGSAAQQLVGNVGLGCDDATLSSSSSHKTEMQRSLSDQSNISTSTSSSYITKAGERRRRQLENSRKPIAARNLPGGPTSETTRRQPSPTQPHRPIQPADAATRSKTAISRAEYKRPRQPKVYCDECDDFPNGFRGEHELKRHRDRAHSDGPRRVWVCQDPRAPSKPDNWRPTQPLEGCKHCNDSKPYPAYYNAAAHLRRAHFRPCKRGRRPKGEACEARAGKAGGDWPPIEWLKFNGWLLEVKIDEGGQILGNVGDSNAVDDENDGLADLPAIEAAEAIELRDEEGMSGGEMEKRDLGDGGDVADADCDSPMFDPHFIDQHIKWTLGFTPSRTTEEFGEFGGVDDGGFFTFDP